MPSSPSSPRPADAPPARGGRPLLLVALGVAAAAAVAVVVAGPDAISRLAGGGGGGTRAAERPDGGKPYGAPRAMDAATATLSASPTGTTLSVVVRGVAEGERVHARLRDTAGAGARPTVFLDRTAPASAVGVLDVTAEPADAPDARRLTVRLPMPVDRVTVIDLRGERRWEGFELSASGAGK